MNSDGLPGTDRAWDSDSDSGPVRGYILHISISCTYIPREEITIQSCLWICMYTCVYVYKSCTYYAHTYRARPCVYNSNTRFYEYACTRMCMCLNHVHITHIHTEKGPVCIMKIRVLRIRMYTYVYVLKSCTYYAHTYREGPVCIIKIRVLANMHVYVYVCV